MKLELEKEVEIARSIFKKVNATSYGPITKEMMVSTITEEEINYLNSIGGFIEGTYVHNETEGDAQ
jgi:uncharacterized membrane-anchored protein